MPGRRGLWLNYASNYCPRRWNIGTLSWIIASLLGHSAQRVCGIFATNTRRAISLLFVHRTALTDLKRSL
jgi:hypothetical protein